MNDIERISFSKLEQEIMKILRKHGKLNVDLETDLLNLFELIEEIRDRQDKIRKVAFMLVEKL